MNHKIGFVGLGKLGLPVATAMALRGADVVGYDLSSLRMSYERQPYIETGPDGTGDFNDWLADFNPQATHPVHGEVMQSLGSLQFGSVDEVVAHSDILFVPV